jgi:hypothetical protein
MKCLIALWSEEKTSSILVVAGAWAGVFYLSPWIASWVVLPLINLLHDPPEWATPRMISEVIVYSTFIALFFALASLRDRFLRRDHLKIKITDYGSDWAEIESDDAAYFAQLSRHSEVYS